MLGKGSNATNSTMRLRALLLAESEWVNQPRQTKSPTRAKDRSTRAFKASLSRFNLVYSVWYGQW